MVASSRRRMLPSTISSSVATVATASAGAGTGTERATALDTANPDNSNQLDPSNHSNHSNVSTPSTTNALTRSRRRTRQRTRQSTSKSTSTVRKLPLTSMSSLDSKDKNNRNLNKPKQMSKSKQQQKNPTMDAETGTVVDTKQDTEQLQDEQDFLEKIQKDGTCRGFLSLEHLRPYLKESDVVFGTRGNGGNTNFIRQLEDRASHYVSLSKFEKIQCIQTLIQDWHGRFFIILPPNDCRMVRDIHPSSKLYTSVRRMMNYVIKKNEPKLILQKQKQQQTQEQQQQNQEQQQLLPKPSDFPSDNTSVTSKKRKQQQKQTQTHYKKRNLSDITAGNKENMCQQEKLKLKQRPKRAYRKRKKIQTQPCHDLSLESHKPKIDSNDFLTTTPTTSESFRTDLIFKTPSPSPSPKGTDQSQSLDLYHILAAANRPFRGDSTPTSAVDRMPLSSFLSHSSSGLRLVSPSTVSSVSTSTDSSLSPISSSSSWLESVRRSINTRQFPRQEGHDSVAATDNTNKSTHSSIPKSVLAPFIHSDNENDHPQGPGPNRIRRASMMDDEPDSPVRHRSHQGLEHLEMSAICTLVGLSAISNF